MAIKPDPIVNERKRFFGRNAPESCGRGFRWKTKERKSQAPSRNKRNQHSVIRAKLSGNIRVSTAQLASVWGFMKIKQAHENGFAIGRFQNWLWLSMPDIVYLLSQ
jgi:hypothetical protein